MGDGVVVGAQGHTEGYRDNTDTTPCVLHLIDNVTAALFSVEVNNAALVTYDISNINLSFWSICLGCLEFLKQRGHVTH